MSKILSDEAIEHIQSLVDAEKKAESSHIDGVMALCLVDLGMETPDLLASHRAQTEALRNARAVIEQIYQSSNQPHIIELARKYLDEERP